MDKKDATTRFSQTKCEIFQADEKTKLMAHIWLPAKKPRAIFIAIHGGMALAGDWVTPALYFKEKGVATYALDLRWHGTYAQLNEGGKVFFHINSYDEYENDINKFYEWVREKNPKIPIFIISHSNGGLIALKYGLNRAKGTDIAGFVVSSPWLKNKVAISPVVIFISKFLAKIKPMFEVTPPAVTDKLTHDEKITARHYEDEKLGLRGTTVSAKLGVESMKTQEWVLNNISRWEKFPVFTVIAGQDHLADPATSEEAMRKIPANLLTLKKYEDNYHENFNEVNRNELFKKIWDWMNNVCKL